jgi:ribonuclease VapC
VIDTPAIVAIALNEPDAPEIEVRIADDTVRLISAATVLEATIVIETRLGDVGGREFDLWLLRIGAEIVPVDAEQADAARLASLRQGASRRRAELRRLLFLRARGDSQRAAAVQGVKTLQGPTSIGQVKRRRLPERKIWVRFAETRARLSMSGFGSRPDLPHGRLDFSV